MESGPSRPFRSGLSGDDYSALEAVSRGLIITPHLCRQLLDLGLISRALGGYFLTAKGSLSLACGPAI